MLSSVLSCQTKFLGMESAAVFFHLLQSRVEFLASVSWKVSLDYSFCVSNACTMQRLPQL